MKILGRRTVPFLLFLSVLSLFCFSDVDKDNYYVKVPEFLNSPKIDGKLENPLWEKSAVLDTFNSPLLGGAFTLILKQPPVFSAAKTSTPSIPGSAMLSFR